MRAKFVVWTGMFLILLNLTACGREPEMPMEVTVDGYTIELGKTTMQDFIDQGYEVYIAGRQDVAKDGDKYIWFYYSLAKDAGEQFWVHVYVPWRGNQDISKELSSSAKEGVVFGVFARKSAAEDLTVIYNDMDLTEMSFDQAIEWGAKEDTDRTVKTYRLKAAQGVLKWEAEDSRNDDFDRFSVQMGMRAFEKMQKE